MVYVFKNSAYQKRYTLEYKCINYKFTQNKQIQILWKKKRASIYQSKVLILR